MDYFVTKRGNIIDANRTLIPREEGNPLFEQYVDFLRNDGTVQETDLFSDEELNEIYKESIPQVVSKMRFFLSLYNIGITRAMVYDAINQISDADLKEMILIKFELSQEFDRADEHINLMAGVFGISDKQLDDLFIWSA